MSKKYISAAEAAKISGYHQDYIGQLCRGGKIEGIRAGRDWLVDIDKLLAYKKSQVLLKKLNSSSDCWDKELLGLGENNLEEKKKFVFPQLEKILIPIASVLTVSVLIFGYYAYADEIKEALADVQHSVLDTIADAEIKLPEITLPDVTLPLRGYMSVINNAGDAIVSFSINASKLSTGLITKVPEITLPKIPRPNFSKIDSTIADLQNKLIILPEIDFSIAANVRHSVANRVAALGQPLIKGIKEIRDGFAMFPQNLKELAQELFPPPEQKIIVQKIPAPQPAPQKETQSPVVQKTIIEKTTEKIISGLTKEELDAKLNELNNKLLAQITDVKNQLTIRADANYKAISLTNRINYLSTPTISYPTISAPTVSGTMSSETISNSGNASVGGTLSVAGGTSISGDLTVGGNAIVTNGQINVGDKVITQGDMGVGTSTPMAKLTIQATNTATSSFVIWGIAGQTLPHMRIFNSTGTEQLTFTADGKLGIGTSSPYAALSVVGQTVSSYFTATSTTATSTFPYLAVSTNSNLGTVVGGTWQGSAIGDSFISSAATWNNKWDLASTTIGTIYGGTGTSTAPTYGKVLVGTSGGVYQLQATSTLGITQDLSGYLLGSLYYATTTHPLISSLPSLSITKSQVSDFGTYEAPLTFNYPLSRSVNAISIVATSSMAINTDNLVQGSTNKFMTYPGAGIALSTGSAWDTSITNASANWNTAYGWGNHASAGYLLTSGFGTPFYTYFSATTTTALAEGTNLYYTDAKVNSYIHASTTVPKLYTENTFTGLQVFSNTATTTFAGGIQGTYLDIIGTAATSTFARGISLSGGCFAINGTCVGGSGTVTSVAMTAPTGLTISGSPITTAGTLALTLTSGYDFTTTAKETLWNNKWDLASTTIGVAYGGTGLTSATAGYTLIGYNSTSLQATSTLFVSSSGNVGIGTTSPAYKLTINASDATTNLFQISTTTNQGIFIVNNQGYAGIGTTSPAYALDVFGSIQASDQIRTTIAVGTAPLAVISTTKVANLNADLLDGFDSSAFGDATLANQTTILSRIGTADDVAAMNTSLFAGQQYIADNMTKNVKGASAEAATTYTHANAAKYCYDLSAAAAVAMDGNTSTTYTDWRLPTVGEAAVFEGTITSVNYIWTATVYEATIPYWIYLRLSDGTWNTNIYFNAYYVRCVR